MFDQSLADHSEPTKVVLCFCAELSLGISVFVGFFCLMLNMNISIPVKISYVGSLILVCQVKDLTYQGEDVMNGVASNESYGLW